jgi:hypothetical protein
LENGTRFIIFLYISCVSLHVPEFSGILFGSFGKKVGRNVARRREKRNAYIWSGSLKERD